MEANRFDALSRALSTKQPRRRLTRLLGGLSLGGVLSVLTVRETPAASRIGGAPCTDNAQCTTGRCLRNDTCSCSENFPGCKQPTDPCKKAKCNFATNRCVIKPRCPEDNNPCITVSCDSGGTCVHTAREDNTPCGTNRVCCGFVTCCLAGQTCNIDLGTCG